MKNLVQEACQGPVRDAVRTHGAGLQVSQPWVILLHSAHKRRLRRLPLRGGFSLPGSAAQPARGAAPNSLPLAPSLALAEGVLCCTPKRPHPTSLAPSLV